MKNDLRNVKVGDWIWTIRDGWMQVIGILKTDEPTIRTQGTLYTKGGKLFSTDKYPSAFLTPPEGFNAEPKPCEFKKGDRVLVSNNGVIYARRYFRAIHSKTYETFADGSNEGSCEDGNLEYWKYCKKWKNHTETKDLSPCCSAPIIHTDICSECKEHI